MATDSMARGLASSALSEMPKKTSDLINDGNGAFPFSIISETGYKIDLEMSTSDYKLVSKLYDKANNLISTSSVIDLPMESMVVNAQYDAVNKKIILTLKNGTTIDVPLGELINGLATQAWVESKGYLTEHQSLAGYATQNWVEAKNYLTEHQSLAAYRTSAAQDVIDNGKQATISDLANIRSGASAGATAVQPNAISDMATKTWVEGKNYLTEHQSLANYSTTAQMNSAISAHHDSSKQDTLTAGSNVTINDNVISATDTTYTAGENITIVDNVISATGGSSVFNVLFNGVFTQLSPPTIILNSCDKTYAEIKSAYDAGQQINAKIGMAANQYKQSLIFEGCTITDSSLIFLYVGGTASQPPSEVKNFYIIYKSDGTFATSIINQSLVTYTPGNADGGANTNIKTLTIDGQTKNVSIVKPSISNGYVTELKVRNGDTLETGNLHQVSGTNDGTNWSTITIDGTTKNIPSGGGSSSMVVNFTGTGYGLLEISSWDKTYSEIRTALLAGTPVVGILTFSGKTITYNASLADDGIKNRIQFTCYGNTDSGSEKLYCYVIVISSNNTLEYANRGEVSVQFDIQPE